MPGGWSLSPQSLSDQPQVEAQTPARATEADAAELTCVVVDPVALHTQLAGDRRGVDEAGG
jgi:hypothetical protein